MSSVSVRFNSFLFFIRFSMNSRFFPATASRFLAFFTIGVSPQGFESQSARIGCRHCRLVGLDGFEPSTSRLSGARSNHLSYRPFLIWFRFVHRTLYPSSDPFCQIRLWVADFHRLVEMMGIEPMTPCLQGRCSPS